MHKYPPRISVSAPESLECGGAFELQVERPSGYDKRGRYSSPPSGLIAYMPVPLPHGTLDNAFAGLAVTLEATPSVSGGGLSASRLHPPMFNAEAALLPVAATLSALDPPVTLRMKSTCLKYMGNGAVVFAGTKTAVAAFCKDVQSRMQRARTGHGAARACVSVSLASLFETPVIKSELGGAHAAAACSPDFLWDVDAGSVGVSTGSGSRLGAASESAHMKPARAAQFGRHVAEFICSARDASWREQLLTHFTEDPAFAGGPRLTEVFVAMVVLSRPEKFEVWQTVTLTHCASGF